MKNKIITKIVMICLLVAMLASVGVVAYAEGIPAGETGRVKIMHVTDIHYIPTYMCYTGDKAENDFATKIKGDPKLMLESYAVLETTMQMVKEANPDYLLVTGDITSNGEKQSLIDSANALRRVQEDIRSAGNKNFQVLVVPGNHDVFNNRHASDYSDESGIKKPAPIASRLEFAKIFSSLGFPDLTDEEAKAFYSEEEYKAGDKHLPYKPNGDIAFVNSTTKPGLRFDYYADLNNAESVDPVGGLTYICYDDEKKLSFAGFDTNLSKKDDQRTEGEYNKDNIDWYVAKDMSKYTQISMGHHNMIPHYTQAEQITPKFVSYGWEEVAERLVTKGIRYSYTGHFHANDTHTYASITNNNLMYEIETGATISYGAAVRETAIVNYEDGTQDFESILKPVEKADFSYLVEKNLIPKEYLSCLDKNNICDIQDYIYKKLFSPWLDNIIATTITPQKLNPMIENIDMSIMGLIDVKPIIKLLINEINTKVLKDYTYKGDNEKLQGEENKIFAYLNDVVVKGIESDVAFGKTLNDLLIYSYGAHLMGGEPQNEKDLPNWVKDAYKKFRSGKGVDQVFNTIIYSNHGIYNLVEKLANTEINLSDIGILQLALNYIGVTDVDINKVVLQNDVPKILKGATKKGLIDINLKGDTAMEYVDELLDKYLNDSLYKGVGRTLIDVASSFALDDTFDGEMNKLITYKYNDADSHSFAKDGKVKVVPTTDNGRLPSEITVTFGENPQSEKNFVWLTSQFAPNGELQYKVVDTQEWTTVSAKTKITAYPDTLMDLGVILTTQDKNIARHNVKLKGLQPNTKYYYRVGDSTRDVWSEIGQFETAPDNENKPFDMAIFAEMQQMDNLSYKEMLDKLMESKKLYNGNTPDIFVSLGDLVDNGLNEHQFEYVLNTLNPYLKDATQVVVPGKQDNKVFHTKESQNSTNLDIKEMAYGMLNFHFDLNGNAYFAQNNYFSFDYSAVHFVVLDTNDIDKEHKCLSLEQVEWLADDLASTTKPFKVVLMHKGIFTPGEHAKSKEMTNIRAQLAPLFYAQKVNIVFSGYEHVYSETKKLNQYGKEAEDGVLYVSCGAFGDKGKAYDESYKIETAFGKDLHHPKLDSNTFVKLSYDGENLEYQGYIFKNNSFIKVQDYEAIRLMPLWITLGVIAVVAISGAIAGAVIINKNKKAAATNNNVDENLDNQDVKENVVVDSEVIEDETAEETKDEE